tara:strand:+ start:312 stop:590 length:279 start_codon:yes stop_codon:yes gene_type:complete
MSKEEEVKKYEMEQGKFVLNKTSEESLAENSNRPSLWGKLVVPDGAKAGDTLKLSAWSGTSKAGNPILKGRCELDVKPSMAEKSESTKEFFE